MDNITIRYTDHPKLDDPIFIEGLPGIGNVGKLAAEHLKDELKAVKFAEIFSKYFPPQVLVQDDGQVKLVNNEMHFVKRGHGKDLVLLTGDYQGLTPEGQYELSDFILRELKKLGVRRIFTLGGYGMGRMVTKPRIVGASGLLLGLGRLYDMEAVCLMGETSGYFVDPKSAQAVLDVLTKYLSIEISFNELENKAKQIDQITSKLKDIEAAPETPDKREDLGYIG